MAYAASARKSTSLWTSGRPEPLAQPLNPVEQYELDSQPVIQGATGPKPKLVSTGKTVLNLASYNFAGLSGNETVKQRAVETLRKYGLGSCGPPGFYGTIDVHMNLEKDIADSWGQSLVSCILKILRLSRQSFRRFASGGI